MFCSIVYNLGLLLGIDIGSCSVASVIMSDNVSCSVGLVIMLGLLLGIYNKVVP